MGMYKLKSLQHKPGVVLRYRDGKTTLLRWKTITSKMSHGASDLPGSFGACYTTENR